MTATIIPARLELCRIVREHCYQALMDNGGWVPENPQVIKLAETALDVPVEEMASWFVMSDTVLANIRLAMAMVEQRFEPA